MHLQNLVKAKKPKNFDTSVNSDPVINALGEKNQSYELCWQYSCFPADVDDCKCV